MQEFNQRWNVENNESYGESFAKFKIRILNILKNIDNQVTEGSVTLFCQLYGIPESWGSYSGRRRLSANIINRINGENNEVEFYRLLEVIFSLDIRSLDGYGGWEEYNKRSIYKEVCQAIGFSDVNLATTMTEKGEIIFYPKGEELLDNELVNFVLSFLSVESNKHFEEALGFYGAKKWVKCAESLRRSLEQYLRKKFNNNIGLKTNIVEIGKKLKNQNSPAQIRSIVSIIFGHLDQFFNDNSKHNDGELEESDAEFLIYQTALLMRYIEKYL